MKHKKKVTLFMISGVLGVGTFLVGGNVRANRFSKAVEKEANNQKASTGVLLDSVKSKSDDRDDTRQMSQVATEIRPERVLQPREAVQFLAEVDNVFGRLLLAGLDKEASRTHLSRLNERGLAGVRAITTKLSNPPSTESEVHTRIAYADYLVYRARFDPETLRIAIETAKVVPSESIVPKLRGAMFAERGELLGALVAIDFENSEKILSQLAHPILRRVAAAETVLRLSQNGMPIEEARKKVKEIIPEYQI